MISDTLSDAHDEILEYLRETLQDVSEVEPEDRDKDELSEEELVKAERHYDYRLQGKLLAVLKEMDAVRQILDTPPPRQQEKN